MEVSTKSHSLLTPDNCAVILTNNAVGLAKVAETRRLYKSLEGS